MADNIDGLDDASDADRSDAWADPSQHSASSERIVDWYGDPRGSLPEADQPFTEPDVTAPVDPASFSPPSLDIPSSVDPSQSMSEWDVPEVPSPPASFEFDALGVPASNDPHSITPEDHTVPTPDNDAWALPDVPKSDTNADAQATSPEQQVDAPIPSFPTIDPPSDSGDPSPVDVADAEDSHSAFRRPGSVSDPSGADANQHHDAPPPVGGAFESSPYQSRSESSNGATDLTGDSQEAVEPHGTIWSQWDPPAAAASASGAGDIESVDAIETESVFTQGDTFGQPDPSAAIADADVSGDNDSVEPISVDAQIEGSSGFTTDRDAESVGESTSIGDGIGHSDEVTLAESVTLRDDPELDEPELDEPELGEPKVDEPKVDEPDLEDTGLDDSGSVSDPSTPWMREANERGAAISESDAVEDLSMLPPPSAPGFNTPAVGPLPEEESDAGQEADAEAYDSGSSDHEQTDEGESSIADRSPVESMIPQDVNALHDGTTSGQSKTDVTSDVDPRLIEDSEAIATPNATEYDTPPAQGDDGIGDSASDDTPARHGSSSVVEGSESNEVPGSVEALESGDDSDLTQPQENAEVTTVNGFWTYAPVSSLPTPQVSPADADHTDSHALSVSDDELTDADSAILGLRGEESSIDPEPGTAPSGEFASSQGDASTLAGSSERVKDANSMPPSVAPTSEAGSHPSPIDSSPTVEHDPTVHYEDASDVVDTPPDPEQSSGLEGTSGLEDIGNADEPSQPIELTAFDASEGSSEVEMTDAADEVSAWGTSGSDGDASLGEPTTDHDAPATHEIVTAVEEPESPGVVDESEANELTLPPAHLGSPSLSGDPALSGDPGQDEFIDPVVGQDDLAQWAPPALDSTSAAGDVTNAGMSASSWADYDEVRGSDASDEWSASSSGDPEARAEESQQGSEVAESREQPEVANSGFSEAMDAEEADEATTIMPAILDEVPGPKEVSGTGEVSGPGEVPGLGEVSNPADSSALGVDDPSAVERDAVAENDTISSDAQSGEPRLHPTWYGAESKSLDPSPAEVSDPLIGSGPADVSGGNADDDSVSSSASQAWDHEVDSDDDIESIDASTDLASLPMPTAAALSDATENSVLGSDADDESSFVDIERHDAIEMQTSQGDAIEVVDEQTEYSGLPTPQVALERSGEAESVATPSVDTPSHSDGVPSHSDETSPGSDDGPHVAPRHEIHPVHGETSESSNAWLALGALSGITTLGAASANAHQARLDSGDESSPSTLASDDSPAMMPADDTNHAPLSDALHEDSVVGQPSEDDEHSATEVDLETPLEGDLTDRTSTAMYLPPSEDDSSGVADAGIRSEHSDTDSDPARFQHIQGADDTTDEASELVLDSDSGVSLDSDGLESASDDLRIIRSTNSSIDEASPEPGQGTPTEDSVPKPSSMGPGSFDPSSNEYVAESGDSLAQFAPDRRFDAPVTPADVESDSSPQAGLEGADEALTHASTVEGVTDDTKPDADSSVPAADDLPFSTPATTGSVEVPAMQGFSAPLADTDSLETTQAPDEAESFEAAAIYRHDGGRRSYEDADSALTSDDDPRLADDVEQDVSHESEGHHGHAVDPQQSATADQPLTMGDQQSATEDFDTPAADDNETTLVDSIAAVDSDQVDSDWVDSDRVDTGTEVLDDVSAETVDESLSLPDPNWLPPTVPVQAHDSLAVEPAGDSAGVHFDSMPASEDVSADDVAAGATTDVNMPDTSDGVSSAPPTFSDSDALEEDMVTPTGEADLSDVEAIDGSTINSDTGVDSPYTRPSKMDTALFRDDEVASSSDMSEHGVVAGSHEGVDPNLPSEDPTKDSAGDDSSGHDSSGDGRAMGAAGALGLAAAGLGVASVAGSGDSAAAASAGSVPSDEVDESDALTEHSSIDAGSHPSHGAHPSEGITDDHVPGEGVVGVDDQAYQGSDHYVPEHPSFDDPGFDGSGFDGLGERDRAAGVGESGDSHEPVVASSSVGDQTDQPTPFTSGGEDQTYFEERMASHVDGAPAPNDAPSLVGDAATVDEHTSRVEPPVSAHGDAQASPVRDDQTDSRDADAHSAFQPSGALVDQPADPATTQDGNTLAPGQSTSGTESSESPSGWAPPAIAGATGAAAIAAGVHAHSQAPEPAQEPAMGGGHPLQDQPAQDHTYQPHEGGSSQPVSHQPDQMNTYQPPLLAPAPVSQSHGAGPAYSGEHHSPGNGAPVAGAYPLGQPVESTPSAPAQPEKKKRKGYGRILLAAALIGALTGGLAAYGVHTFLDGDTSGATGSPTSQTDNSGQTQTQAAPPPDSEWTTVAQRASASTVAIAVRNGTTGGEGSGVVLDGEGHIVTNNHVLAGATAGNIRVLFGDRGYEADIVGTDPSTDLAVIQVKSPVDDMQPIDFADSDQVRPGDDVLAIGNPLGLAGSVTSGIVSAVDRPVTTEQVGGQNQGQPAPGNDIVVTNAIQTSAAINPGNSGGALVNARGELIGINSSIASLSDGSAGQSGNIGIGFAIPANQVAYISQQLIDSGKAEHAQLGVSATSVVLERSDGTSVLGARIQEVTPNGAANQASIVKGDTIIAIDQDPVTGTESLIGHIRDSEVGQKVELDVVNSKGEERKVPVTLGSDA